MDFYDMDLFQNTDTVNRLLARYGVKFGIYKNNVFHEQLFPLTRFHALLRRMSSIIWRGD